jgi:hypothetical protein
MLNQLMRVFSIPCAMIAAYVACAQDFQGSTHLMPFDEDLINYNNTPDSGPVAELRQRLESGKSTLHYEPERGWLMSVLDELKIPHSSQMLVFSRTSLQRERISPKTPRSIFYGDNVYLGFIPGAPLIELTAVDPKLGAVFYTVDQTITNAPKITRTAQCLECHASAKSMGVPGHLVRSFATDDQGIADINTGTSQVNHRTPLEERWGGWYVTGTHGKQTHRGNLVGKAAFERHMKDPAFNGNVTNLSAFFDVKPYVRDKSDIVALMVLEHQTHMHNFITRLNYESKIALQQYGHVRYLKTISEAFLKYLLFTEETPLTAQIQGDPQFVREFSERGPRDKQGRSLRDFDLKTRLFKYPCSYVIYSDAFDALPGPMKEHLYKRLWEILSGQDTTPAFASLDSKTRRDILEILTATKEGLPSYWKSERAQAN